MPLTGTGSGLSVQSTTASMQEVVVYPVSEDVTGEISDDGVTPDYLPSIPASTSAASEGAADTVWSETIDFEAVGTTSIISIYYEFEWQTQYTDGGGSDSAYSKVQVSGDGGSTYSDLTDNFSNSTAGSYTNRIRAGVSNVLSSITAGSNQLAFRLVHWVSDASDTSQAQIRTNSYARITYKKS